ncbi:MAG: hypothetical protein AMJ81_09280 [Phycisphaerae bacterium SM23_33]|jgi:hypothetical protein|nr:MAG: hypothetical protein AMJ81_09280 [Phycisphaerae bacterium SM23_33]
MTFSLSIRADRIDPAYLTDGRPPAVVAELTRAEKAPGREHRHFVLSGLAQPVRVQLNGADPTHDEGRLRAGTEYLLGPLEAVFQI